MSTSKRITLPEGVSPKAYHLSLFPCMTKMTFRGVVKVDLEVSKPVEKILLHSSQQAFQKVAVTQNKSEKSVNIDSVKFDKDQGTVEIPTALEKGTAELQIDYTADINDHMIGFYRSTFKTNAGKSKAVGCTQFESTDARLALPCWDEPSHKATFDLDITTEKKYVVLSNQPEKTVEELPNNYKKVTFETSPKMSTYLLAWFIGEYGRKMVKSARNVPISVYAPEEKLEKVNWALDVAKNALDYFEDYFGINYPLAKVDMLALSDFVNGAMENWGLITYRDTAIYSDKSSGVRSKEWVAHVVTHELAHMWFGNLVTMEWWSQLWLNEGFATFMQNLANDKVYPEWGIWTSFLDTTLNSALNLDALNNSHPVEVEVNHSKQIDEIFDTISYLKGASLLKMLHDYIGAEAFRAGVSLYLKKFSYQNTESDDLWNSLTEASGKDVQTMMTLFTRKQGFPVVEIEQESKTGNVCTFKLKQSRFLIDGKGENDDTVWHIPIKVDFGGVKNKWILMDKKTMDVSFEVENASYIILNSEATGFFRIKYADDLQGNLRKAISEGKLSVPDRFMMLSDTTAMFKAGKLGGGNIVDVMKSYSNEEDTTVWFCLISTINLLKEIVRKTETMPILNQFSISLAKKISNELGRSFPDNENPQVTKLRGSLISLLETSEDQMTIAFLKEKYENYTKDKVEINPNIFATAISVAMKYGGEEEFETVKGLAESLKDPMQKIQCLSALGNCKNREILKKSLDYILSGKVREQDTVYVYSAVYSNSEGTDLAWEFFKANYTTLRTRYKHNSLFSNFVAVVSHMYDEAMLSDAKAFFKQKDTLGVDMVLKQSYEKARLILSLKEKQLKNIDAALRQ